MSEEIIEIVQRGTENFFEGRPAWELYTEDFQFVDLPDAPWQPGMQAGLDFFIGVTNFGAEFDQIEAIDSDRVLKVGKVWWHPRTTGIREEMPVALTVTVIDGKITRIVSHHTREEALEAAGLA